MVLILDNLQAVLYHPPRGIMHGTREYQHRTHKGESGRLILGARENATLPQVRYEHLVRTKLLTKATLFLFGSKLTTGNSSTRRTHSPGNQHCENQNGQ
jgi:hypothetical protein